METAFEEYAITLPRWKRSPVPFRLLVLNVP